MIRKLLFSILFSPAILLSAACSHSSSQISLWQPFTFNGVAFVNQRIDGLPSLWVREGYYPRTSQPDNATAGTGRLQPGSGAVSGTCYIHSSGGKIADKSGFDLLREEQITVKNASQGVSVIRSDSAGFFTEELFPGRYELFCRGAKTEVTVRESKTVLAVIRGGKRMVD